MSTGTIILLGAFAGLTIYLGLPIARIKDLSPQFKAFLSMLATGILIFLLYDVFSKGSDPVQAAIDPALHGTIGPFVLYVLMFVGGVMAGLIGLTYLNHMFITPLAAKYIDISPDGSPSIVPPNIAVANMGIADINATKANPTIIQPVAAAKAIQQSHESHPVVLSIIIASGIGMHNLSEGLAIGQSAATGALQLATVLIIGFGLHNMTEGFGIAGPLSGRTVSWKFISILGLIGGGPTFLGTVLGIAFHSTPLFVFCLAFAGGAIIYVLTELLGSARRFPHQIVMWGLFTGFLLGYCTDLIVSFAGA